MSNYDNSIKNLDQIIEKFNTNNGGKGFSQDSMWTMQMHVQVTQAMATVAMVEELRKLNNTK